MEELPMRVGTARMAVTIALVAVSACGSTSSESPDNGISSKPAAEIVVESQRAFNQASSVHVVADVQQNPDRIKLDLAITSSGDASGTVGVGQLPLVDLRAVGGKIYIRGRRAFWEKQSDAPTADIIGNHWVYLAPGTPGFQTVVVGLAPFGLKSLSLSLFGDAAPGAVKKGPQTQVNGQPALSLGYPDGVLLVATTGPPYPLRLDVTARGATGQFFSLKDYGAAVTVAAPKDFLFL